MNPLRIICAGVVLALASCATPYAAQGTTGGYKDAQINQNTYQVSFNGNGLTSGDMVWNYWIYRCAELTREKGYDLMVTVADTGKPGTNKTDPNKTGSLDSAPKFIPAMLDRREGAQMVKTRGGSSGGSRTVYTPGTTTTSTITTYHKVALVRMFNESDVFAPRPALRAQVVLDMLKPYVDSAGKVVAPSRAALLGRAMVTTPAGSTFGAPTL